MKSNVKIKIDPKALKKLEQDISASIWSQGIQVSCPNCGNVITVYGSPAKCPNCDQEFQVALKF